jgi:hypothetical protein
MSQVHQTVQGGKNWILMKEMNATRFIWKKYGKTNNVLLEWREWRERGYGSELIV